MKKLIKLPQVLAKVPVSRAHLYVMIRAAKFPSPVHLGGRGSYWLEEEIDAWIDAQIHPVRSNPTQAAIAM